MGDKIRARPELLAPAGTLEKLRFAVRFGADAVYFGLKEFSLRNYAGNFSVADAEAGLALLHDRGKKGYAALNIYPFSEEYDGLLARAETLDRLGVDGLIVSDLGLLDLLRKRGIRAPIHISTQANVVSPQTAAVLKRLGASRVNLARELSLEQVARFQEAVEPIGLETEVFIHGAVCLSTSGRCAISDYLTGRRANRGECTHPCRWRYHLVEEKRPGEYLPVFEDDRGLYLFNCKDLALFPYVSRLAALGVTSFKIEGRMKSIHYLASVVSLYRRLIDGETMAADEVLRLLSRVKNRGYSQGFAKGAIGPDDYRLDRSEPAAHAVFLGEIVEETDRGRAIMNLRNKVHAGETVEVLKTDGAVETLTLPAPLVDIEGEPLKSASHGRRLVLPKLLPPYSVIRRVAAAGGDIAVDRRK